jgi:PAS domain S-box-containing protein
MPLPGRWVNGLRRAARRLSSAGSPRSDASAAAQLAALVASADDAIVSKTLDGIITSWNRAAERMFGYSADEAVGRSITLIIPPDRHGEEVDILSRLRRGEAITHFETERVAKDGRRVPISLAVSPIRDASGRIIGASKIARDVSDRRRAEHAHALRDAMRKLEALCRLADEVSRAKDLAAVCDAAVDAIVGVGADRAGVLLLDADRVMRFQAWRNLSPAYRAAVDGHSPWPADVTAPEAVVIEDVVDDGSLGPLREVVTGEGIRALAFVPLVSQGRLLGKFMIYYDAVHAFSADEMRLGASIAQHVSFGLARVLADASIEKLLAGEQSARRDAEAARLDAEGRRAIAEELARLASAMAETLDGTTVADRIVAAAMQLFRARAAGLRLAAPDGSLRGIAFAGGMSEMFAVGHTVPPGPTSMSGLAMMQGDAVWTDDSFADPRLQLDDDVRRAMERAGDAAVLAAPLRHGAVIIGALSIADRAGRRFTAGEARTLQAFADQAALAISNARLYEEARRRQREAEFVAELARRINASLDLQTTLERLVEGARELCDGDIARIVVRDPDTGRMRLRHQLGTRWEGYHDQIVITPGHGSGGIVLLTGRPFRTDDYTTDPRISADYLTAGAVDGTVAQLVVPIPGESGVAGLLYVDRRTRRAFTDADEALLTRLADHAATAIRNSQLFAAERAARADADAANRGKDQFLAVLSHELRTPLSAILGWARLLRGGQLNDAQRSHALGVIERNAELQGQLIADLLDMSRIAAGKMEIDRAPVDLVLVVREAVEAVAADVATSKLTLATDLDDTAGEVLGDARRLRQVVSNLLFNAIKFTPEGGRIDLQLVRHETSARLTVRDNGQGIDPAVLPRIFDPFEQGDRSTTRAHQGLGLGLAIVKQIVGLHGGTIHADSAGPGHGATFTVDLSVLAVRLHPGHSGRPRAAAGPSAGVRGLRVLIVDDQPDARDLLAHVLTERGAEVHVAGSASEALQRLGAHDMDALVSDISMPEIDGYELIRAVRRLPGRAAGRLHAVAVTAFTGHAVRDRALAAGFDAHATKPLDPEHLVELLTRLRER